MNPQQADWFTQNAPKAAQPTGDDWFAQNQAKPKAQPSTAADTGIGVLKSVGRNLRDLTDVVSPLSPTNPMGGVLRLFNAGLPAASDIVDKFVDLKPSNDTQRYAGLATDVASIAIPAGLAARGGNMARAGARRLWSAAADSGTLENAETLLRSNLGRLTNRNLETARNIAGNSGTPLAEAVPALQHGVARAGKSRAVLPLSRASIVAAIGQQLPAIGAGVAQGAYNVAPALQATSGGLAGITAALIREALANRQR